MGFKFFVNSILYKVEVNWPESVERQKAQKEVTVGSERSF